MTNANTHSLLQAVLDADREDRQLLRGGAAGELLTLFADIARSNNCTRLMGASPAGERLIGALLFQAGENLAVWEPGTSERVLVVEGVALGDAAVLAAMEKAVSLGAVASCIGAYITPGRPGCMTTPGQRIVQVGSC